MQNFILYAAYGNDYYINQCRYSLLKLLSFYNLKPPVAIVLYTDQPAAFEAYASFFRGFEMKEIKHLGNKGSKPAGIDLLHHFFIENEGNVLYCDADTYITGALKTIFKDIEKGIIYLYDYDGTIDKPVTSALQKRSSALAKLSKVKMEGFSYTGEIKLWNTTVLGLNNNYKSLLENAIVLQKAITQQVPNTVVAPFALSYQLQQKNIAIANKQVAHYKSLKEFSQLLHLFFQRNEEESIPNLVKRLHYIDVAEVQRQKDNYVQLPFYKKWLNAVTGKKWSLKQYQHKI